MGLEHSSRPRFPSAILNFPAWPNFKFGKELSLAALISQPPPPPSLNIKRTLPLPLSNAFRSERKSPLQHVQKIRCQFVRDAEHPVSTTECPHCLSLSAYFWLTPPDTTVFLIAGGRIVLLPCLKILSFQEYF